MTRHGFTSHAPSTLAKDDLVAVYGGVYEHSPWIAAQAHGLGLRADHDTAEGLSQAFRAVVETAGDQRQLELLRAHPDLAGKLAVDGKLTEESTSEQTGAGLDQCTVDEFARFQSLNEAYTGKFGFPFILAVAGYGRHEILEIFERRVGNDVVIEMREALDQVHRIALFRLIALAENGAGE